MINRFWVTAKTALIFILVTLAMALPLLSADTQVPVSFATEALVRVEVKGPIQDIGLPIYAHLCDPSGNEYALVIAPLKQISATGFSFQILDDPATIGTYYLALERRKGARQEAAGLVTILHDDGRRILVKGGSEVAGKLSELGFNIKPLPVQPIILRTPFDIKAVPAKPSTSGPSKVSARSMLAITYDSRVAVMINKVQQTALYDEIGNLSGENAVTVGGSYYAFSTRNTNSGTPIQKATQYVYERMTALGLTVSYHDWSSPPYSSRNVVGSKTGTTRPTEIVLITAHLDDMPSSGLAPGADDNASGCAALLIAAQIMTAGNFERTLRFVFFTGEEQGLYGSTAYAGSASSANENIVAVYNMDMISWDSTGGPVLRLHTRLSSNPGYNADMAIASTFSEVVSTYGLLYALTPVITSDGEVASDHSSFWDKGYSAIVAIQDDYDDFNPYYHTANDTRQSINLTYFTNFTKASVGTAAHLAVPANCVFTLSPTAYEFTAVPAQGTITVTPSSSSCTWTAASNTSWITIISGSNGIGPGTVTYGVAVNIGTARTGTITISGQTFTVTQAALIVPPPGSGGGCFIATAAFGSPMTGHVEILRQFRDRYLLTNHAGQKFVAWYYRNGPTAANYIKGKPLAKAAIRVALYPLIGFSFLLISGYLPFVAAGLLLTVFLFLRFRPMKSLLSK